MDTNKKAFTLVELIISITMLSILGFIGFISYTGYLTGVRDSIRVVEIENIKSSLESYSFKNLFYIKPTNPVDIFYSGGLVWSQGTFGNDVASIIGYSEDILDPLTKTEYTYSVKNSGKSFSIAGVLEEDPSLIATNSFFGEAYSATIGTEKGRALVSGNYNGELISVKANSTNYILALPSIISSDLSSNNLVDILNNNKLVYNDFENLPASYTETQYNLDANLDFSPNKLIIFSGSISDLKKSSNQIILLQELYNAYTGSLIYENISVSTIDSIDLFDNSPSSTIKYASCDLINYKLKYFIECN